MPVMEIKHKIKHIIKNKIKNNTSNNISLIGFMGSGKSSTGRILAERLGYIFIDIDEVITIQQGIEIQLIFEKYGEKYFRMAETDVIKKIYTNFSCVFACGGGVVLKKINMDIIKKNSTVIYLKVSPEVAYERLKESTGRPLLSSGKDMRETIKEIISKRENLYSGYADIIIDTDNQAPELVAAEILSSLKSRG